MRDDLPGDRRTARARFRCRDFVRCRSRHGQKRTSDGCLSEPPSTSRTAQTAGGIKTPPPQCRSRESFAGTAGLFKLSGSRRLTSRPTNCARRRSAIAYDQCQERTSGRRHRPTPSGWRTARTPAARTGGTEGAGLSPGCRAVHQHRDGRERARSGFRGSCRSWRSGCNQPEVASVELTVGEIEETQNISGLGMPRERTEETAPVRSTRVRDDVVPRTGALCCCGEHRKLHNQQGKNARLSVKKAARGRPRASEHEEDDDIPMSRAAWSCETVSRRRVLCKFQLHRWGLVRPCGHPRSCGPLHGCRCLESPVPRGHCPPEAGGMTDTIVHMYLLEMTGGARAHRRRSDRADRRGWSSDGKGARS